jgi:hypothetical protein
MQHGQQHLPASYLELIAGTATAAAWENGAGLLQGGHSQAVHVVPAVDA